MRTTTEIIRIKGHRNHEKLSNYVIKNSSLSNCKNELYSNKFGLKNEGGEKQHGREKKVWQRNVSKWNSEPQLVWSQSLSVLI